jgi:hypothetical protein
MEGWMRGWWKESASVRAVVSNFTMFHDDELAGRFERRKREAMNVGPGTGTRRKYVEAGLVGLVSVLSKK